MNSLQQLKIQHDELPEVEEDGSDGSDEVCYESIDAKEVDTGAPSVFHACENCHEMFKCEGKLVTLSVVCRCIGAIIQALGGLFLHEALFCSWECYDDLLADSTEEDEEETEGGLYDSINKLY